MIISNITAFLAVMLLSCENPIKVVQELASDDTIGGITAYGVVFYRSDSGHVQVELEAPKLFRQESESENLELANGFVARLYNASHAQTALIQADYGVRYGDKQLVEARGNVHVENLETKEMMDSDELFWYQDRKMIHARTNLKIVTPDKIIFGDSLTAQEDFSKYSIYNVTATFDVEDEESDSGE